MTDLELFNVLTYDTIKTTAISDIPDVFTNIGTLDSGDNEAGLYEFNFALSFNYDSTTTSVSIRWRIDGGAWASLQLEPSDVNDSIPVYYGYPGSYTAGVHTFELEIKKGAPGNLLNLEFADMVFKRVGV